MTKVFWIGTGVMGSSMAKNLAKGGYDVTVYNRSKEKAQKLAEEAGLAVADSIKEGIKDADFIFTIVGYPSDVKACFQEKDGIFENAKKGSIVIDMTTSSPTLAVEDYKLGKEKGIGVLDAPVSGGDSGARNATLSIMVGGDEEDFNRVKPLFEKLGTSITYCGESGMGQHTKAANQIVVAGNTAAYTEALIYAEKSGLDPYVMLKAISGGAAGSWQVSNMAPRVLKGDLAPGFFVKHFIKDMKIIREEMETRGIHLEMLDKVYEMYKKMEEKGLENDGTQALLKIYKDIK